MASSTLQQLLGGRRNNYTLPTHQIAPGQFNPIVFNPVVLDFKEAPIENVQQGMMQYETKQKELGESQSKFNEAVLKLQSLVNPAEHQWANEYIDKISKDFNDAANSGELTQATKLANIAASTALSTPEAIGRIKYQEEFTKEVERQKKRRDAGEIKNETFEWWMSKNDYNYKDIIDENGNIIAGDTYKANFTPVKDADWSEQFAKAYSLINPDYIETDTSSSYGSNVAGEVVGKKEVAEGYSRSSSGRSKHSKKQVSDKEILTNMQTLFDQNSDLRDAAYQQYEVDRYKLEKVQKEIDNLKEQLIKEPNNLELQDKIDSLQAKYDADDLSFTRNGGKMGYKEYYSRRVLNTALAKNLAYIQKQDVNESSSTYNITTSSSSSGDNPDGGSYAGYWDDEGWHSAPAPGVKQVKGKTDMTPRKGESLSMD